MTDQPDPDWPAENPSVEAWTAGSEADESDRVSDERDSIAEDRDNIADDRELIADERERVADDRDLRADDGDDSDKLAEQQAPAEGLRRAQSVERGTASLDRGSAAADRVEAAGQRNRAKEALAVGAHGALNSSAVVVSGISVLRDQWPQMKAPERTSILERIHRHANSVDNILRRFVRGR